MNLRELLAQKKLSTSTIPVEESHENSLLLLLILYERGSIKDVYLDDFNGFKYLLRYLSPLPSYKDCKEGKVLRNLRTYETQEISRMTGVPQSIITTTAIRIQQNDFHNRNR